MINCPIKIENIAFWYWLIAGIKSLITFLFFRSNPALGTFWGSGFNIILVFFLLTLVPLKKGPSEQIKWPLAAKLLFCFILWSALTLLWGYADSRFTAFAYWLSAVLDLIIVLLMIRLANIEKIAIKSMQGIVAGAFVFAVSMLLSGVAMGDKRLGDSELLYSGLIANQMSIGVLCCVFLMFQAGVSKFKQFFLTLAMVVLLLTLVKSLGKASIVGSLLAMTFYMVRSNAKLNKRIAILAIMLAVMAISYDMVKDYLHGYLYVAQEGEALSTLSGRSVLWEDTLQMIVANPFWGYGFLSFRNYGPQIFTDTRVVHAHNEWLQVWFTTGIVGLVLVVLVYVSFFARAASLMSNPLKSAQARLGIALLIYAFTRGLTDASTTGLVYPLPLMLLLLAWMAEKGTFALQQDFTCKYEVRELI